jgi:hypothetical protein
MESDEPMEAFEGKMTLAYFMADRANRLEAAYTRAHLEGYSRWLVRLLEKQLIQGGY